MKLIKKLTMILSLASLCFASTSLLADDPEGEGVITALEGIVIYYVAEGDKVAKGDPLYFIRATDYLPARIKQIKQQITYFKKVYNRNLRLAKTNAVAVQDLDSSWNDYHTALNDLAIAKQQAMNGFYTAPYDCVVTKLAVPPGSGIGDGNPALWIKKTN